MRKGMAVVAFVALSIGACTDAEVDPTAAPSTTSPPAVSSTVVPSIPASTTTTWSPPPTSYLGPTVTYDPDVPRYGGEVVIADDQEPPTLNPFVPGGDNFIVWIIGQAHLAGAYDIDPDSLELIPELVTQIPTVGNGGVVLNGDGSMDVTWQIRPEAVWSDGVPISGTDFAFTLEFEETAAECSELGSSPEPLPDLAVTSIEDKSFTARFSAASLEHELMFRFVVPQHAVAASDYCEDWNVTAWPAAGPFVLDEWVKDGSDRHVRFVRNTNYWKTDGAGNQLPYLDEVRFEFIPETENIVSAFTNRRVDVIQPPPFLPAMPRERWQEAGADVQLLPGPVWEHLNFQFGPDNRNLDSLNGILEFRQAIAYGLDRRALLDDAGYEWLEVSNGVVSHSTRAASSEPWSQYSYDRQRAIDLLTIACDRAERDCAANPPNIIYSTTSNADFRPRVADQLVEHLADIGIEVDLQLEDSQLFFGETLETGDWDMGNWAWVGQQGAAALPDFLGLFAPSRPPIDGGKGFQNYYNWGTPGSSTEDDEAAAQFQALYERLVASTDASEIVDLARQAEEILAEQVVIIPLNTRAVLGVVWADEIQGYRMNPTLSSHTWNIEHWYRIGE
ncbi:MAG: hypothetical protein GY720_17100 [bacterium]|nr:hypothetical protein [bacterium]